MNEDRFAPKIEGIEKDDAEKIVSYRKAREQMKKLLETDEGNNIQEEIKSLDPFKFNEKKEVIIDKHDIKKVDDIVEKSKDENLVKKLTVGLEKRKIEFRKKEIEKLVLDYKKEIERIENKLKILETEDLEEAKEILEKNRQEIKRLELKIKSLEDGLRKLE